MEQTSAKREKRKSLLRIAIPIILSSCLQISYDITDMFWVGKLGSGEVAAVGTAGFYIKLGWLEKPRDFDPFGQTGFAHLWLQYD